MEENSKQMSFLDHLEELRWRLVKSAIAIIIFAVLIWIYQSEIIDYAFLSMKNPSFITYKLLCEYFSICTPEINISIQSTTMGGQFSYAIMMSLMGGVVVAFPYVFYQLWSFIKPGLKHNEKSAVKGIVFYVSLLFFTGIGFGYYVVAPLCVQFFGTFQLSKNIENIFTVSSYMSTILSTIFYTGLMFLLPVVAYILAKIGIINADFLKKYRKHSIVVVLILAAVITPPDLISQVIVAIPLLLLYEISIFVTKRIKN
jgi:sec-independent protein translocase protein TatC